MIMAATSCIPLRRGTSQLSLQWLVLQWLVIFSIHLDCGEF